MHLMVDLETLATTPNAAVLTIGACTFDPMSNEICKQFYEKIDIESQEPLERHIDNNTLEWWGKQDPKIREEALGDNDRVSVNELLKQLNKFTVGCSELWCQGPLFDYAILEHLYKQMGQPFPWNFWQIRDSRTVFSMMPQDPRKAIQEELHNALADCYYQAKCIQSTFKHFGVKK